MYNDMRIYDDLVRSRLAPGGVVVYDDMDFSRGTERFWRETVEWSDAAPLVDGRWDIAQVL
jgi:hypothetical protein